MPLGGGYGGMFEPSAASSIRSSSIMDGNNSNSSVNENESVDSLASSKSGGSVFSFASKIFSKKKSNNPYTSSSSSYHSINSRGSSYYSSASHYYYEAIHNSCLVKISRCYLQLPFRLRYFVQLFSIVGVFMLASQNYFIAMENSPHNTAGAHRRPAQPKFFSKQSLHESLHHQSSSSQNYGQLIMEGGGASPNQIPRLRVRDPMKFLHHDLHPNELLERATAKFRSSTRFGNVALTHTSEQGDAMIDGSAGTNNNGESLSGGSGPFVYGWKSMPRQIYNDFSTGLSDDSKTIENPNNQKYFQNKAQKQVGFSDHEPEEGDKARSPPKGTVAYVLPITTCYADWEEGEKEESMFHPRSPNHPKDEASFRDFAMMLRAMVHANSYRNKASGSVYDYKMHAIIHPRAKKCRSDDDLFKVRNESGGGGDDLEGSGIVDRSVVLQNLGYHISLKYPPLTKSSIQGSEYLKEYMAKNVGQIVDLIRLYAYELEGYDAVVLVDYDTLILGPVDKAVDLIVDSKEEEEEDGVEDNGNANDNGNDSINTVFSWEHLPSLANPQARASVINLSFFLLRPSKSTFQKLILRYQNAPFSETRGWGTMTGRGSFPGWMTTQGFLTYYYDEVENAGKVEMNRCSFGNTGEDYNSNDLILVTNGGKVECGGGDGGQQFNIAGGDSSQCNDCSKTKFNDVLVADLSYCRAPWECGGLGDVSSGLCRQFQKMWFDGRLQMEDVHPQLQKGSGKLCIDGQYQPMQLLKPSSVAYTPNFME